MSRAKRLRVLVLSNSYPNDLFPTLGVWIATPTMLLAREVDVRVIAPVPYCPPFPHVRPLQEFTRFRHVARVEHRDGVEVSHPRFPTGAGRAFYSLRSLGLEHGIRRTVDRLRGPFPFDLIHAHFVYPEGAAAHRLAQRYDVPFVITEHAPWTETSFAERGVRSKAVAAARAASTVLAVSRSVRDTIAAFGVRTDHVRTVPVGVDQDLFAPGHPQDRRSEQILFVGWPNFNKGVDVLLEAMALLRRQGTPGRLVVAGGSFYRDTRRQEERLHELAARLKLGDRVQFIGWQPQAEVARLMAESAVVVLPSRAESFGAVLVEALACGTPVVATRCGGPEEIVRRETGLLVPVGDAPALADAITDVLTHQGRYVPQRLRAYALDRFGWPEIVKQVHGAYVDAVGRPPSALPASPVRAMR